MANTGAGTDSMNVTGIMGIGVGAYRTDYAMQATDVNGGEWIVRFTSGNSFDTAHALAQSIGNDLSVQAYRERFTGATVECLYNEILDTYHVAHGGYSHPLEDFEFEPAN